MGKTRRSWSREEKRALLEALKLSVIKSWRGENGFRSGHFKFLKELMDISIPGNTISAQPNIKSMVTTWKKEYGFLSGLLSKSGVNWNNIQKKVECTQESWDEECKALPAMKNKMDKPWPFYEEWVDIFGKDRATGDTSVNHALATPGVQGKEGKDTGKDTGFNETDVMIDAMMPANEDVLPNNNPTEASNPTEADTSSFCDTASVSCSNLKRNKRKATCSGSEDGFMEVVSGLVAKTDETLLQIVKALAPEQDNKNERQSVFDALDVFPVLTMAAKVAIGRKLAKDKEELEFFFSLPHEARLEYVTQLSREL